MSVEAIRVPQSLALVLNRAGDKSGVDFDYLVQTALRESSFNPNAKAQTSSAVGLFQFIESTWLEVMKLEGDRLGYGNYVQAIERDSNGKFSIQNSALRNEVLALREDPQVSADLAAAFTRRNGEYLSDKFGRNPSPGELYIAHFLGARGAERMFNAGLSNPDQIAAEIFPQQAEANRSIFYDNSGARTIREVYQALVAKHGQPYVFSPHSAGSVAPNAQAGRAASPQTGIQPRIGPGNAGGSVDVSFSSMFTQSDSPQSYQRQVVVDPGGALFVQLYGK